MWKCSLPYFRKYRIFPFPFYTIISNNPHERHPYFQLNCGPFHFSGGDYDLLLFIDWPIFSNQSCKTKILMEKEKHTFRLNTFFGWIIGMTKWNSWKEKVCPIKTLLERTASQTKVFNPYKLAAAWGKGTPKSITNDQNLNLRYNLDIDY